MTSLRQIEANRRNALKSTGPKTELGKQQSAQNAVRHGLTAETVIKLFEDSEDYHSFELAVTSDYSAETTVERELVLRLASLLWRLRRATSIETGLMQIQGEVLLIERSNTEHSFPGGRPSDDISQMATTFGDLYGREDHDNGHTDIARCFLRLASLDKGILKRLGRYEATIWRQVRQTIITLEAFRWAPSRREQRSRSRW